MVKKILLILSLLGFLGLGYVFYYQTTPVPKSKNVTVNSFDKLKSSYQINYEKIGALSLGRGRLVVTSMPTGAGVGVDGKERGRTPLVLEDLASGEHELSLVKDGYEELKFSVDFKDGWLTRVSAKLLFNPLRDLREAKVGSLDSTPSGKLLLKARADWATGPPKLSSENLNLSDWQQLHLYSVDLLTDLGEPHEILTSLDTLAQERLSLPAVPFAYLITEDGTVYEGLGIYNFNYEGLLEDFAAGEAPVLIVNQRNGVLNSEVRASLVKLQDQLKSLSRRSAEVITVLDEINLQVQEKRELAVEFVNTGNVVWGESGIALYTEPNGRVSEFYSPADWVSSSEVADLQTDMVMPGETTELAFNMVAPPYSGEFTERFSFLEQIVEIQLKVEGEAGRVVKITDTPTGSLNVREGPSIGSALKGVVYPGEKYLVLEESAGWLKLRLRDDSEGWVINRYAENF